jgi:hypothetical protein
MSAARVAILTPDPTDQGFHLRWRSVLERIAAPLRAAGMAVEGRSWAEASDLGDFDLVMPLLVWGYHRAVSEWREATKRWEKEGTRIRNGPSVLCWNADKLYLRHLSGEGAPVVPTLFVDRLSQQSLEAASTRFGTDQLVAKPQVSALAWQTIRWASGATLEGGPTGPAIIQPYLPSIETDGEISLIYLEGRFNHAIRKRPQPGDFRVQPEYDAIITAHEPTDDELAAASGILAKVEEDLLYARVDLVRGLDGTPLLMELELVEPDLYLEHDPAGGVGFVEAVARAAARD